MNLRPGFGYVLVLAAAVAAYFRAASVGFLSDEFYLPLLLGPDGVDFRQVLRDLYGPWLSIAGSPSYRPGITLHYAVDLALFGWNPLGFHLSNVLLHALCSGLVWSLARLVWREASPWCWCVCGLVFALHPAAAEAVCWISGRVDTTTAFPYLLSLLLLARWSLRGGPLWLAGALAAAAVSLFCKESAITIPFSFAVVDALVRRRRPAVLPVLAAAVLAASYLALRAHALGRALAGAEDSLTPAALAGAIPGKLLALFSPAAPKTEARPWVELLHPVLFGGAPILFALRNPTARRFLPVAILWCCALVLPSFQVHLTAGYGGTRVVYLALLPYALLTGRALAAKRRSLTGVVAAAALLSLAALLTDGRNRVHVAATRIVHGHQAWVLGQAASVRGRGLFLADIMREVEGVTAFRFDNAYLAFRRPFLPVDVPVYVGSNMAIGWFDDTAAVQAAFRAGMEVATFDAEQGKRFESLSPAGRGDLVLPFDGLQRGEWTFSDRGLELPGGKNAGLEWQPMPIEVTAFEGASLVFSGPEAALPVLSWRPELPAGGSLPAAVEQAVAQMCRETFLPYRSAAGSNRLVAPLGNRAGWTFAYRFRSPFVLRLSFPVSPMPVALREVRLLARLPPLDLPAAPPAVDPSRAVHVPVGPGLTGSFRLVLLTPMQVLEEFATDPPGAIEVSEANRKLLALVARLAPGSRIAYVVDRLAHPPSDPPRPGDRSSTTERSEARSFVLQ